MKLKSNKPKKAVSNIISAVLLILVAITSIITLTIIIKNINKPLLSPEKQCINLEITPPLKINNACYNSTSQEIQIQLTKNPTELEINDFDFVIKTNIQNYIFCCTSECPSCQLQQQGTKTFFLDVLDIDEENENFQTASLRLFNCQLQITEIRVC